MHGNPLQCPDFFSETHFMCCDFDFFRLFESPGRRPSRTKVGLFGLTLSGAHFLSCIFRPENESSAFAFQGGGEFRVMRDKMKMRRQRSSSDV
jgi:hypothetical protein